MRLNTLRLIYFSFTRALQVIGGVIARGTGLSGIIKTDLTYGVLEKPFIIEEALTLIVVPVYRGRAAGTVMERFEGVKGQEACVSDTPYADMLFKILMPAVSRNYFYKLII